MIMIIIICSSTNKLTQAKNINVQHVFGEKWQSLVIYMFLSPWFFRP